MALADLELSRWDENNKRDRLTGCSMTGFEDAMGKTGDSDRIKYLKALRDAAHNASSEYASELRVAVPLLVTCAKPEGTGSVVLGGVSPGVHNAHSPYHIRRIRISSDDALAKAAIELGWTIHPEVGTPDNDIAKARTLVIDFPIVSHAERTKDDVSAIEQIDRYLMFQKHYTDHNTSNTITVKPNEWDDVESKIKGVWDEYVGVSFLAHDGGTYMLAPYEAVTKEEVEALAASMKPFDPDILQKHESTGMSELDENDPSCATGACPTR